MGYQIVESKLIFISQTISRRYNLLSIGYTESMQITS